MLRFFARVIVAYALEQRYGTPYKAFASVNRNENTIRVTIDKVYRKLGNPRELKDMEIEPTKWITTNG